MCILQRGLSSLVVVRLAIAVEDGSLHLDAPADIQTVALRLAVDPEVIDVHSMALTAALVEPLDDAAVD